MATIRQWLNDAEFNWENAVIVYHDVRGKEPGFSKGEEVFSQVLTRAMGPYGPIAQMLDTEFKDGHGGAYAPRFIADDGKFLYFPEQYDGATTLVKVAKTIEYYLDLNNQTPYPGG